jgi:YVTN family beta-propeller protein
VNISQGVISQFTGQPLTLQQELPINPAFTPIYVVGNSGAPRVFAISQLVGGGLGQVSTIETVSNTIDPNPITVGKDPVYGVMTADNKRAFILNQTDGTVSVINAQTNQLDVVPVGATNPITVGTSPLWADFAPTRNEMIVANAGDGVHAGTASIISIPLCSAAALPTNPNCDPTNPVDAVGFGTVLATVPVGINPRMVGVLQDGTRAYVLNGGNPNLPCAAPTPALPLGNCTVSVINLTTNTVTATIPISNPPGLGSSLLNGHPNYIAVTTGTPTGKVYVTSPESNFMTVIRTDTDTIDLTVPLQGNGVSVRITQP